MRIYDYYIEGQDCYIVSEYCVGNDLFERIRTYVDEYLKKQDANEANEDAENAEEEDSSIISEEKSARIMSQIFRSLYYLHS